MTPNYEVKVTVINIIEGNLTFPSAMYNVSVKEDVSQYSVILSNIQVRLNDPGDNGLNHLQFQVEESYLKYFFLQLDQNQPLRNTRLYKLKLQQQLNYSSERPYRFTAVASLEGHSDKNATANFTVYVEDVDNQNPKFTKKSYEVDVAESPSSTPVTTSLTVQAIDQDTGINTTINYRLVQEIPSKGWFSVDKTSGAIKVIKSPDRETCSQLTLFIKGYQVNNEALRYDVTWVDVTITDVDDNPPVIEKSVYNISIPENSPTGTNIVQVLATDKDEGNNTKFSFHFVTSNVLRSSCKGFGIDQATGMIKVQDSAGLDRERHPTLSCQVKAKGTHGKHLLSNASSITVNLVDENDNNPVFNMTEYSFYIKKNQTVGSIVGEVKASDKDLAPAISYTITDKSLQTFLVNLKTGKITLNVSLTENFLKLYSFEIVASDGDKKAPRYTSVIVNVHVQDVNLHAPVFTQKNYHLNLMEDVAVGTDLIQIKATDKDPDDTLTYRITKSNSHFKINSTSGMLSLVKSLDYEVDHSHSINITVTDSVRNTMTTFSVTVLDINDNAPKFQNTSYIFTNVIEEDSNRNVGTVLATDIDGKGNNSEITYSIEPPWKANFSIGNGGKITVIGKLDRESIDDTEGHIKFVVIATDHGQPSLTGTTEVTVEVTDINDNCPYINAQDLRSTYVFKELETRKDFHHIQVEDMDKTDINRQMTYSFIGSHDGFTIDPNSGNLSATKALEMEHTKNGQIELTISVSNNPTCKDNITVTQTIVINVQDINRFSPQFTPNTYSLNVKENYTVGSKLDGLRINATDRDTSPKYNTITYWIGNGDPSGHFYMDSKTAEIYLVKPLDYENLKQFVLTIYATDGHALYNGTSINATGSVTINVQNVNDNTPKFNQDVYLCKFDENSQTSKNGCTVKATDGDKDTLSYNLNNTMFKINQLTGDITVSVAKGLDYDDGVHKYMLQVLATDNGRPKLTGTAVVEVDVLNLNDNSPSFSNKTYTFKVMEDASVLTMVGIIQASDKDGDKLKYSIASNKPEFSLDSDTGLLILKSSLIDKTNITFTVQAKDSNKKTVTIRQDALQCDTCDNWQHRLCETGISKELYNQLVQQEEEIDFYCKECGLPAEESSIPQLPDFESTRYSTDGVHEASFSLEQSTVSTHEESHSPNQSTLDVHLPDTSEVYDQSTIVQLNNSSFTVSGEEDTTIHLNNLDQSFDITQHQLTDAIDQPTYSVVDGASQRGKRKLVDVDGYTYTVKKQKGDSTTWWCSVRNKTTSCSATVLQKGDNFTAGRKSHCHTANPGTVTAVKITAQAKSQARQDVFRSAGAIVETAILQHSDPSQPADSRVKQSNLVRVVQRTNQKLRPDEQHDLEFKLDVDFIPPGFLQETYYLQLLPS
ncbi:FAT4 [Mytilus edulis]|uniref:FAT4 n=1 Tax=Mytilus edulis TaxID=6550 RepID=A0A8S3Q8C3_MYTED|nr:FAT4 [Mytilus edulis]